MTTGFVAGRKDPSSAQRASPPIVRQRAASADPEYAPMELHGTEGHTVLFRDERRLGRVAWIEYGARSDQPDALIVRRRFYERPRLVRIPAAMVLAVERKTQTLHIDVAYNPNHFFLRQPVER
jgi:hypothetical protein